MRDPATPSGFRWATVYVLGRTEGSDPRFFRLRGLEEKQGPSDFSYWRCNTDDRWYAVDRMTGVAFLNKESISAVYDAVHDKGFLTRFRAAQETDLYKSMVSNHYKGMVKLGAYVEL